MSDEQTSLAPHPSPFTHHPLDRTQLRLEMRRKRNAVPLSVRRSTAKIIAQHLSHAHLLRQGQRIAVYAAIDGEIDLIPVVNCAQRARCALYAPRITDMRARKMEFIELGATDMGNRYRSSIRHQRNRLDRRIDPRLLDVVLVPLVAFDVHGWRLGFGAGFYDRKFAFTRRRMQKKPRLIGVGYEFQRVAPQNPSHWDVLLHAVVTERGIHRVKRDVVRR